MQRFKDILKQLLPHVLPFLIFFLIVSIYFFPLYEGKTLVQSDNIQLTGTMREVIDYQAGGEVINWTNVQFSGMPLQTGSPTNIFKVCKAVFSWLPQPIVMMLWLYLGFYILMIVSGTKPWIAGIASMAYAFSSFNVVSIEVGHDNKVYAIAFMAPVLAGALLAYRKKYLQSLILTSIFLGFQIYFGHIQISYYLLIVLLALAVKELVRAIQEKEFPDFIKGSAILILAAFLAVGGNIVKLWKIYEYSGISNRGGSELTQGDNSTVSESGLDLDYALNWSSGKMELFTIMIPYFHGGASGEELDEDSAIAGVMRQNGVPPQQVDAVLANAPTYWGDQPFTQGPIYFGVLVVCLFVVSLFLLDKPTIIWGVALIVLSFLLAMGKNLLWFSELFYYYVPMYNKFRSVTMILAIPQLLFPYFGFIALNQLMEGEMLDKKKTKAIFSSIMICGGLLVFFLLFKGIFFDFRGINDANYRYPDWLLGALRDDRISLFNSDILRGIFFLGLAFVVGWFWQSKKLSALRFISIFGIILILDMLLVDRRYLGADDFQTRRDSNIQLLQPTQVDLSIKQDDSYFRVFNTTRGLTGDGITSNHHFSVGGYSAIKIQRYQEIIERYLSQGNVPVLSMLNTKYFIVADQNNQLQVRLNNSANGNAWLVGSVEVVENADEEIAALGAINLNNQAVTDRRFVDYMDDTNFTTNGRITLQDYHPERMTYSVDVAGKAFAVFSEIFYDIGWQAYLDGEPVEHIRVNYVLRGMIVPPGAHEIQFIFEPGSTKYGKTIAGISHLIIGLLMVFYFFTRYREFKTVSSEEE